MEIARTRIDDSSHPAKNDVEFSVRNSFRRVVASRQFAIWWDFGCRLLALFVVEESSLAKKKKKKLLTVFHPTSKRSTLETKKYDSARAFRGHAYAWRSVAWRNGKISTLARRDLNEIRK